MAAVIGMTSTASSMMGFDACVFALAPSNGLTPIGPNPCSTADPTKLNYNVVNNYRRGPDTALNHISQGHISFFTGKSTYYGLGPGNLGATGNMMRLNALTLNQGLLMRISSNGALTLTYYSPLIEMPMGPFTIVQGYVGTDQSGAQTQFNTLIVKGCTDPQTSHPGIP